LVRQKVCNIHKGEHLRSTEENKAMARRFIEEGWNQGKLAVFDELCNPDYIYHDPVSEVYTLEDYKQLVTEGRRVYSDFHLTIEDLISEGDKVVLRYTGSGINTGDFVTPAMPVPIPATGKQVTVSGMSITRIAEGKAIETWNQADNLGALQQLGLLPAPGQVS
jgi:predicted ester cyclase